MISLDLDFHRKARIWVDELPNAIFTPQAFLEQNLQASSVNGVASRAAVELFVPRGARYEYGLLGAQFQLGISGVLCIRVGVTDAQSVRFVESLGKSSDSITVGLPREFGDSVLRGSAHLFDTEAPGRSGILSFQCAASDMIGSNKVIFELLGRMVCRLLIQPGEQLTPEQMSKLFEECHP